MKNFTTPLRSFALGGNATFTVQSEKTGVRFTFKVRKPNKNTPHFVSLLTGPDNENSFTFLGTVFNGEKFVPSRKSPVGTDAPSMKAFAYVWERSDNLPDGVSVYHEGKCGCCGRKLTTPESVTLGIGPECLKKMG